jgi:LPXTG-motif cell wall-anchored protein
VPIRDTEKPLKTTNNKIRKERKNTMKGLKKLLTGILAATLVLGMSTTAFAQNVDSQKGGNATITITNTHENEEYKIYKVFDATVSGGAISYQRMAGKTDVPAGFEADSAGNVTYTANKGTKETDEGFVADLTANDIAAIAAYVANDTPVVTVPKADDTGSIKVTGLEYGYYFVATSTGAIVSVNSTNPNASIKDKNDVPTSEKKVEEDSTNIYGDKDDADIGQVVNYRSTVKLVAGARNVVFEDKMTDSLDLDSTSIKLYTTTEAQERVRQYGDFSQFSELTSGYTVTDKAAHSFKVVFDDSYTTALTDTLYVIIRYSAKLNENAIIHGKETKNEWGGGNDNESRITYGNEGHSEWDWVRTYTYPVNLKKVDSAGNVLAGAKFKFALKTAYDAATDKDAFTNYYTFTQISAGDETTAAQYRRDPAGTVTEMVTPKSGRIEIVGLDADEYYFIETEAPAGYNKLDAPIQVSVVSNTNTADGQGDDNGSQAVTVSYKKNSAEYTGDLEVENNSGALLPSTGGIGTTIFYIVGALLICAAVVFMIMKRKGVQAE